MPDDELDPAASTQMFQAFVDRQDPEPSRSRWVLPGLAVAAVVVASMVLGWSLLVG